MILEHSRKEEQEVKLMMDICETIAQRSKDIKTKVGCVIAKDTNILSYGYNGTPHGANNNMRDKDGKTLPIVVHAEINALAKLAKSTQSGEGAVAYCTLLPCLSCTISLFQAGIKTMYYRDTYRDLRSLLYGPHIGFEIIKVKEKEGGKIELVRT